MPDDPEQCRHGAPLWACPTPDSIGSPKHYEGMTRPGGGVVEHPDDPATEGLAKGLTELGHGPLVTQVGAVGWHVVSCDCGWESEPTCMGSLGHMKMYADHLLTIDARDESLRQVTEDRDQWKGTCEGATEFYLQYKEDLRVALAALERIVTAGESVEHLHRYEETEDGASVDTSDECELCAAIELAADLLALSDIGEA